MGDLDLLLFAMVAAFLVLRLRSVLGKRTGHQQTKQDPVSKQKQDRSGKSKVVELPINSEEKASPEDMAIPDEKSDDPLLEGVNKIKTADSSFDLREFSEGAREAFVMIVQAFAEGNVETLESFLSDDVFENFSLAIQEREERKETLETAIIGIDVAEVIEADMDGQNALITMKFVSEQVNLTRDSEDRILDGVPDTVTKITDIWMFSRDTKSDDPNWRLVETRSQN
ncbi:MAG: Tim44/TimA family putative adaptor protein [Pseudomonadota bacterium]|nr:Tim44/TimA family putative adaptor protein [Pseudomonadota bacterium]